MIGITISDVSRMHEGYRKASPEEARRMVHSNIGASIGMGTGAIKGAALGSAIAPGPGTGIGMIVGMFAGTFAGLNDESLADNLRSAVSLLGLATDVKRF